MDFIKINFYKGKMAKIFFSDIQSVTLNYHTPSLIKMVGYKLSKNDWVTPYFVIFRSVREKLFVTVSFDHPVF